MLIALVVILQIGDLVTTYIGLSRGKREKNPLGRWLHDRFGFAGMVGLKLAVTGLIIWVSTLHPLGWTALILVCAMMAYAIWHNVNILRRR